MPSRSSGTSPPGRDRPVLYLDYDGVLHPEDVYRHPRKGIFLAPRYRGHRLFEHAQLLVNELAAHPRVLVILSTSWVRVLSYSRAAGHLPFELRQRVVGATYHSRMSKHAFQELSRGQQVLGDVGRRRPSHWLALDDDDNDWPADARPHLLHTHPVHGLAPKVVALRAWLNSTT